MSNVGTETPLSPRVRALIVEIEAMLERFAERGQQDIVDIWSLPLTHADREDLDTFLGRGAVTAEALVDGRVLAMETGFPALWRVIQFDEVDDVVADHLAVCGVPEIVAASRADARDGLVRLRARMQLACTEFTP